jgi:uncharacterized membrane protein YgcG
MKKQKDFLSLMSKGALFFCVCTLSVVVAHTARAETLNRSYVYDRIEYQFVVKRDTTVQVKETQAYRFEGEYHQGNRSIPLRGVDMIDAASVRDADTGRSLVYTASRLDKTNPSSYGQYTTYRENGKFVIEWYYDARDTTHTWTLQYTLHGAISFLDEKDELYWNLFTEYQVPVKEVKALVILPQDFSLTQRQALWYTDPVVSAGTITYPDNHSILFSGQNFPAFGKATIAAGWPRGVLERSLYWRSSLERFIWVILAALVVFISVLSVAIRYLATERWNAGRGTVIPEYEPPRALPPAMAEVIIKETVSDKAWSATIVDLAVRGFVKIEEIPATRMERIGQGIIMVIFLVAVILFLKGSGMPWQLGIVVFGIWFLRFGIRRFMNPGQGFVWVPKNYRIVRFPEASTEKLEEYERQFLDILFSDGRTEFSTKEIKKASQQARRQKMHTALMKLRESLLEETAADTHAYAVGFKTWYYVKIGLIVGIIGICIGSLTVGQAAPLIIPPFLIAFYSVAWAVLFFRYNPRLSREGQIFKEEWLGFKLYLETAEKYRLQNLTPETFERYLPYAIIFGAEKKWGRAFSGIAIEPPRWYGGTSGMNGAMGAGFSAASFTSSFGASFSSAFSSAGGGASSGGGSAGGGGGGGGGGAS